MLFFLSCCIGRDQFVIIAGTFLSSYIIDLDRTFTTGDTYSLASFVLRPLGAGHGN
jgi:hypothetical protein